METAPARVVPPIAKPGRLLWITVSCVAFLMLNAGWSVLPPRGEAAEGSAMKIGFATINDPQHEWAKRYKTRLEQRTGGRIAVQLFPASQLGSIPRMIEGVQLGTIESYFGPPDFLVGIDPRFQVLTAPFLFENMDHAFRVINDKDFLDKFLTLAEAKGIKGAGLIAYAPASFVSRTPIRTPEDMKGKKFRVLATPIEIAMMASLGATGIPMPLGEVLPALQQGALDGVQSALTVFTAFKYYDVVKYHTNTDHYIVTSMNMVSKKWYDALPPDLQRAVIEEARADHAGLLAWTKDFYNASATLWKEKTTGGFVELTPAQREAFRSRMQGVDEKVAQQVAGVKEWLDLLRAKGRQYAR